MTVYVITGDQVAACQAAPDDLPADSIAIGSLKQLTASSLSTKALLDLWRSLGGVAEKGKARDRDAVGRGLWRALKALPTDPPGGAAPAIDPKPESKQAMVVNLLRRPDGATLDELVEATGWQRHSVRGVISGGLKKKLGLTIVSDKVDAHRRYRITA